jgi:disulfide bond formation protein DsbB
MYSIAACMYWFFDKKVVAAMHKPTTIDLRPEANERVDVMSNEEDLAPLSLRDRLLIWLSMSSRYIALLAAWVATCGSLFMSEVLGWPPCILCWYQRILMYPLSILIAVGILRRDRGLHLYVLPLAFLGACVSIYHYAVTKQIIPPPACTQGISCVTGWINWFGFINVPFLALIAFIIIIFMMLFSSSIVVEDAEEQTNDGQSAAPNWLERAGPIVPVIAIIVLVVGSFLIAAAM